MQWRDAPHKPGRQFPGIGTGAVIIENGCLLLMERQGSHGANTWAIPGGWLDHGETPKRGVGRECYEEIGCVVRPYAELFWTNEWFPEERIHSVTLLFACEIIEGTPFRGEPEKCSQLRWVPVEDVEKYPLFKPLEEAWYDILTEMFEIHDSGMPKHNIDLGLG